MVSGGTGGSPASHCTSITSLCAAGKEWTKHSPVARTGTDTASAGAVTVAEHTAGSFGTLSATDPDSDPVTFSVVGDTRFTVGGTQLQVATSTALDFERDGAGPIAVTIRTTDSHGASTDTVLSVTIGNVNPDIVTGTSAGEVIMGGTGKDVIAGGGGDDSLFGGDGDDALSGDAGADFMFGGKGDDRYVVDTYAGEAVVENPDEGTDVVYARIDYAIGDNIEQLILVEGTEATRGSGNGGDNVIIGNSVANLIYGLGGNDSISGGGSNDSLIGGDGDDNLDGGIGADQMIGGIGTRRCVTHDLMIHGSSTVLPETDPLAVYGSDAAEIRELMKTEPEWTGKVHPRLDLTCAEVIYHARHEMARTIGDVLARRSRSLLLDAQASMSAALRVGHLLASELGWDAHRTAHEVERFQKLAAGYILEG